MNQDEVLRCLDEHRRSVGDSAATIEILPDATRVRGLGGGWLQIAHSRLSEANADAVIAAEIDHFRALGGELEWTVYSHDPPGDLLARLERHGFEVGLREAVLVLDLLEPPGWMSEDVVRVVRVTTPQLLADYCRVYDLVFGKGCERSAAELSADMATGSTDHLGYVAFDTDRAVSIGRLHTASASLFAGMYGGGTLPTHRGKGFYRATVAARAREAVALGARYLRVDALPTSQPILERLGFQKLTETWSCTLHAQRPAP